MPIAMETDKAKSQHYELPTSFFELVLGKNLKYCYCYFEESTSTLDDAEVAMFDLYYERAQVEDRQSNHDLGCGWSSLSLYLAKKYKNCKITGICNSKTQKAYIDEQCSEEWLKRMDKESDDIRPIMESTFGKDSTRKWTAYWRTFFISVAELFAYNSGDEWMVANFLFKKK